MTHAVIFERGEASWGAYVPDLPGCAAVGESLDRVRALISEAIGFHLEGLREDGHGAPEPASMCEYVEVGGGAR